MYLMMNFFMYSFLGFMMESTLYKIKGVNKHSGLLYGPVTLVYGVGIVAIILLDKYVFKFFKGNRYVNIILKYIILVIVLSFIECIGGHIIKIVFDIDMWDYSLMKYHLGKYLCLFNSLLWGMLGIGYLYFIQPFSDKVIKLFNKKVYYFMIIIFLLDIFFVMICKI